MNRVREIINAQYAEKAGIFGKDVGVAVLDTGIYRHPDFGNRIVCFKDFLHGKNAPYDDCGHGTQETYLINKLYNKKVVGIFNNL